MTRSEGPPHFTPVGYQERIIREADVPAPETISADTFPQYRAEIKFTRLGDTLVSGTLYGPADFLATAVTALADAFRDEVQR